MASDPITDIFAWQLARNVRRVFWTVVWAVITLCWMSIYAATAPAPFGAPRWLFGAFHFTLWVVLMAKVWRAESAA